MNEYKQIIVVRSDLKMSKGKTAVQCCHASVGAYEKVGKKALSIWKASGQKKVVLKVKGIDELMDIKDKCDKLKIPSFLVSDAGLTELSPGTTTVLGIGPDKSKIIDKVTGSLSLLK